MSIPIKHHYLPEWFQRRWADPADGKVYRYKRPFKSVVVEKVFPVQTGCEPELYAVPSRKDPAQRQALESEFMSPVDRLAAEALTALEADGVLPHDGKLASDWSRFVLSLLYRTPERVAYIRRKLRAGNLGAPGELEARYAELRGDEHRKTLAEYQLQAGDPLYEELEGWCQSNGDSSLLRRNLPNPGLGLSP